MSRTLLLADDSVTIQRVLQLTFSGEDVRIVAVGDGEQAISRLAVDQPDIVLADIGMPKRNGYDLAAFIKGQPQWQHIPVLLLAGAFEPVDHARAEQARCDGVLVKPFEPRHVVARVRELLEGARGHATTPATAAVDRPVAALIRPETPPTRSETPPPTAVAEPVQEPQPPDGAAAAAPDTEPDGLPAPAADAGAPQVAEEDADRSGADVDGSASGPLDEYLDRLDARFASRSVAAAPAVARDTGLGVGVEDVDADADVDVPTLDRVLGLPDGVSWGSPDRSAGRGAGSLVRDAFDALLAIESGEDAVLPVPPALPGSVAGPSAVPPPALPIVTDAFIDEVVARVVARLAPDLVRHAVADVVSDVAERLVREEIARIRAR